MVKTPTPYEILELIEKSNDDDVEETIAETRELIENIRENPKKFTNELEDEIEEYSAKHHKCPICGKELKDKSYIERSEYFGFPVDARYSDTYCPEHGLVEDL